MIGEEDLRNRFFHHPPSEVRAVSYDEIRGVLMSAALDIDALVPDGREKSRAMINLEQAMFWSNAGIARAKADE